MEAGGVVPRRGIGMGGTLSPPRRPEPLSEEVT